MALHKAYLSRLPTFKCLRGRSKSRQGAWQMPQASPLRRSKALSMNSSAMAPAERTSDDGNTDQ